MKERKLTIKLYEDELGRLAQLAAGNGITQEHQAERYVTDGICFGEVVHRIDPFKVATLCGYEGPWRATNMAASVNCPRCMELLYTTAPAGGEARK